MGLMQPVNVNRTAISRTESLAAKLAGKSGDLQVEFLYVSHQAVLSRKQHLAYGALLPTGDHISGDFFFHEHLVGFFVNVNKVSCKVRQTKIKKGY